MQDRPIERRQLRGVEQIREALDGGASLRLVLCLEGERDAETEALLARCQEAGIAIRRIAERELRRLVPFGDAAEILALEGSAPPADLATLLARPGVVWLLAAVSYPGNAGYAIRSAEVSGAAGVVIAADFDRVERRDCLRFGMRVDRFFPVLFADADRTFELARTAGRRIVAVEDVGGRSPWEVDLRGPCLIAVGGEQSGVAPSLLERADVVVRVPMHGFLPSYNLQAAMAVVMGERLRQLEVSRA